MLLLLAARRTLAKAPCVEWEGHRALLVPKPGPKSLSHTAYVRMIPASL